MLNSAREQPLYRDQEPQAGLVHYFQIAKRRIFHFFIPFTLLLMAGAFVVAIQRPIYEAAGKILVVTQEIPAYLVKPTVTESANQRIEVIHSAL